MDKKSIMYVFNLTENTSCTIYKIYHEGGVKNMKCNNNETNENMLYYTI